MPEEFRIAFRAEVSETEDALTLTSGRLGQTSFVIGLLPPSARHDKGPGHSVAEDGPPEQIAARTSDSNSERVIQGQSIGTAPATLLPSLENT
jgi:hypothetical protein